MMANFYVGQNFSSFSEFEQCLSRYENENFVKFYKRNSRKLQSAVQSGKTKVALNPDLIYYEIIYNCVKGGAFRVQGTGKRKTSSCKIDCPAHISVRAAADGKTLEVKSFHNTHNHEISKVLFDLLPQQRRLSKSDKNKAIELLRLQANKKLIRQKLQEETGKIVTSRDLYNLTKSVKSSSNELHEAVSLLQKKYLHTTTKRISRSAETATSASQASTKKIIESNPAETATSASQASTKRIIESNPAETATFASHASPKRILESSPAENATSALQTSTKGITVSSPAETATSVTHATTKRIAGPSLAQTACLYITSGGPSAIVAHGGNLAGTPLIGMITTQNNNTTHTSTENVSSPAVTATSAYKTLLPKRPKLGETNESSLMVTLEKQIMAMDRQTIAIQEQNVAILQQTKAIQENTAAINAQTEAIKSMLQI